MEAVLKLRYPGIHIYVPWKRIISAIISILFWRALTVGVMNQAQVCAELPTVEGMNSTMTHAVDAMSTNKISMVIREQTHTGSPRFADVVNLNISEIPKISVKPTAISTDPVEKSYQESLPDEALPVGILDEIPGEEGDVSNSYININGFLCDENGLIVGYEDMPVADGVLAFPNNNKCTGIAKSVAEGLEAETMEIYIPGNITYIEPGAFDNLTSLFYIEVAEGNPNYYSSCGILYLKTGEVFCYPAGR